MESTTATKADPICKHDITWMSEIATAIEELKAFWVRDVSKDQFQRFEEYPTLNQVGLEMEYKKWMQMADDGPKSQLYQIGNGFVVDIKVLV